LPDTVLRGVKREVADEEGRGRRALRVSESLAPLLSIPGGVAGRAAVDLDSTAIDLLAVHLKSLLNGVGSGEVYVAKSARPASVAVGLDGRRLDLTTLGELLGEAVVVDAPRELADEDGLGLLSRRVGGGSRAVGELDLLGGGFLVVISLALGRPRS
jgi:hypothetical protein